MKVDISVIICTRNRARSLKETLECLARADRAEMRVEIVVVDNASEDETRQVVAEFGARVPTRYFCETALGKGRCLNRALDEGVGEIVAILDDDMSPEPGWFIGVRAICNRWPDKDIFTGRSYVIWPVESVPDWCLRPKLRGWAYSVLDSGEKDRLLAPGRWFSGNHFWFRSRGLTRQRRFPEVWNPEPQFMLQMVEDGFEGVAGPDAACGHRVQLDLLRYDVVRNRAVQVGRSLAAARLLPYKSKIKQARLMKERPVEGRLYCVASVCGWAGAYVASWLDPVQARRIERRLQALERISTYREYLRIIGENRDYALFRDRRI